MRLNLEAIGRLFILLIGFSTVVVATHAFAKSEIIHNNTKQVTTLEKDFASATKPTDEKILNKTWTCELYGMQTKMQRAHSKKLYLFLRP